MLAASLALVFAASALSTDFKAAPLFAYPSSFAGMAISDEYIPGATPYSNAVRRLTATANAAMLATPEAVLERLVFPYVSRYGGGRDLKLSALPSLSLEPSSCTVYRPASGAMADGARGVPSSVYAASSRDLSVAARRMSTANSVGLLYALEQESRADSPIFDSKSSAWLAPQCKAIEGSREWCVNDQVKTAPWDSGFLLRLNEIGQSGVYDAASTPLPYLPPLVPQRWEELDSVIDDELSPTLYAYFSVPASARKNDAQNFVRGTMGGDGSRRGRSLAALDDLLRNAAPGLSGVDLPHVATNSTPRVWWEKFALWNALSANLRVRLDRIEPVERYATVGESAPLQSQMGFNPTMVYRRLENSKVMAFQDYTLARGYNTYGQAFSQSAQKAKDGVHYEITSSLDLSRFDAGDVSTAGTSVNVVTNYSPRQTTRYVNAWADRTPALTVTGTLNGYAMFREAMPSPVCEKIDRAARQAGKTTAYAIALSRIVGDGGIKVKCEVYDVNGGATLTSFTVENDVFLQNATGAIRVQYSANLVGRECLGVASQYVGPTYEDGSRPSGSDAYYNIWPSWFNDSFATGGLLKSAKLHEFATAVVTTNAAVVAASAASLDDEIDAGSVNLYPTDDDPVDAWLVYRATTDAAVSSYSSYRVALRRRFISPSADVNGAYSACGLSMAAPTISDAINVNPSERLSAARAAEGWSDLVESTSTFADDSWGESAPIQITYDATKDAVDFIYTATSKSFEPWASTVKFATVAYPISFAAKNPVARPSAAIEVAKDFMLQTEWAFPQMTGAD